MSKESLKELNKTLVKHFEETGIKNAFYYEPLYDYYWNTEHKIGICNLEPYTNSLGANLLGIKKVDDQIIVDCWYNSRTIQRTLKMFQLITKKIEEEKYLSEEDLKYCDNKDIDNVIGYHLGPALYFNLRLTVGNQVNESKKQIIEFYKDPFYQQYFRDFLKETELDMLILNGQTSCKIINMIFPDLNLEYLGRPKKIGKVLICSAQHPTRRDYSNKELIENINEFFYYYWENKDNNE